MRKFIDTVEAFLAENPEVSASALGMKSLSDPSFVRDLRRGRSPRAETIRTAGGWMSRYRQAKKRRQNKQFVEPPADGSALDIES